MCVMCVSVCACAHVCQFSASKLTHMYKIQGLHSNSEKDFVHSVLMAPTSLGY